MSIQTWNPERSEMPIYWFMARLMRASSRNSRVVYYFLWK